MLMARRAMLGSAIATAAGRRIASAAQSARVGVLRYGTVSWELDVIRHHKLDEAARVWIVPMEFAAPQATQVALQGNQVDLVVVDWLWVARQRDAGTDWTFVPFSNAVGALIAPANSPIRAVSDLVGRSLGIAGSPLDKSWLILRAYAKQHHKIDLDAAVDKSFASPPLFVRANESRTAGCSADFLAVRRESRGCRGAPNPIRGGCSQCSGYRRRRAIYRVYFLARLGWAKSRTDRWVPQRIAPGTRHPRDVKC